MVIKYAYIDKLYTETVCLIENCTASIPYDCCSGNGFNGASCRNITTILVLNSTVVNVTLIGDDKNICLNDTVICYYKEPDVNETLTTEEYIPDWVIGIVFLSMLLFRLVALLVYRIFDD